MKEEFNLLICIVFGHKLDGDFCSCQRCGGGYTYHFGIIPKLIYPFVALKKALTKHCGVCGKRLLFRKRYKDDFCSKECYDEFIPF